MLQEEAEHLESLARKEKWRIKKSYILSFLFWFTVITCIGLLIQWPAFKIAEFLGGPANTMPAYTPYALSILIALVVARNLAKKKM